MLIFFIIFMKEFLRKKISIRQRNLKFLQMLLFMSFAHFDQEVNHFQIHFCKSTTVAFDCSVIIIVIFAIHFAFPIN